MKLIMESWRSFVKEQQESPMPEMGTNLETLPELLMRNKDKICGARADLEFVIDQMGDEENDIDDLLALKGLDNSFREVVKDLVTVVEAFGKEEVEDGMKVALDAVCTGNETDILDTAGVDQEEENQ